MSTTPQDDPSWLETLNGKSFRCDTDDDISAVKSQDYFAGVSKGAIIKVQAMDGMNETAAALMVTNAASPFKTDDLNPLDVRIANGNLSFIAFKGDKWDGNPPFTVGQQT